MALTLLPWQDGAIAQEEAHPGAAAEPAPEPTFQDWLAVLRQEARGRGISDATLDAALRDVSLLERVLELDRRQPEFTQTFLTYLRRRVTDERVERGRALLWQHHGLLDQIYGDYGVPPQYLIAFWGLETNFGDHLGGFRVIDALATLAYDERRAEFFRAQLLDALRILEEGHIALEKMSGSWAGAMGHMQFIPSTFIAHAVDYNSDGRKDIWGSLPDAFSSAANFLSNLGWRHGESWGREVRLPRGFDLRLASGQVRKPLSEWSAIGVRRAGGEPLPKAEMEGAIVLPQGHKGPAFMVYDNFRVILRWNRSINYAIAVGHLADRIVGLPQLSTGLDAEHEPLSRHDTEEIQQQLNKLGFDAGRPDGVPGPRTGEAIRAFQLKHSLPPDGYASPGLLQRLRELSAGLPD